VNTAEVSAAGDCQRRWLHCASPWVALPGTDGPPMTTSPPTGDQHTDRSGITASPPPENPAAAAGQVADLLDTVHEANARIAAEIDRVIGCRAAVSQTTIDRFIRLAAQLSPGNRARAALSELDPDLLLAGVSVWTARRRARTDSAAITRAERRWSTGMSA
jgi:hypothetical protein